MPKKSKYADMFTLRSDGRYQAYYYGEDGKRHFVYNKDPEVLYFKLQEMEQQAREPKPVLFSQIAGEWEEEAWTDIRMGTKQCYSAPLRRAVDRFGDTPIKDITTRDINAHLMQLSAQCLSKSTIKSQKVVYSLIFTRAISDGILSDNPASFAQIPASAKKPSKRTAPEDDVVNAIREKADTAYFGLFAFFLLCTGFRRGEALAVKWKNIDFNKKEIHCESQIQCRNGVPVETQTKSESGLRTVPLLPALEKKLKKPSGAKPNDYVFFGSDPSKPMPESTYNRRWNHYCQDMGFVTDSPEERISKQGKKYIKHNYTTTLTAHTLRHGYATMLFESGVEEETAMSLMGHSNIRITMEIYTHLRKAQKNKSTEKLLDYSQKLFGDD